MKRINRLSQKQNLQLSGVGFFVLIIVLIAFLNKEFVKEETVESELPVSSPYVPESIDFCGEAVPLQYYDVFESLERELIVNQYFHSQTLLQIKKAERYFPVIESLLKENNIPDDFKYLMVAESSLSYTVSPAGAAGFWQLLESTARDYKLEVNQEVDERYHLEKATRAACLYLKDSYEQYGNWTMVAASYNVGRRGVEKQIERQGENNYYDLLFNEETARYVFRILAIKAVMKYPEKYNFNVPEQDRYHPIAYRIDTLQAAVPDLGEYARQQGTNYKLLKYLNPWLRDNKLSNPTAKKYLVQIPTEREIKLQ